MAGGILSLLRQVFSDKMTEIDRDYYGSRCDELKEKLEKQLEKKIPAFRELTKKIKSKSELLKKLDEEIDKLKETRNKLFPPKQNVKAEAEKNLRKEYFELRTKAALEDIPTEKVKKLLEDFQNKDYLAEAMGV